MWLLVWPLDAVWVHLRFTLHAASDISDQWHIIFCPIEKIDLKVDLFSINRFTEKPVHEILFTFLSIRLKIKGYIEIIH